jgi:N-acetylmuramoyl-L-alanine amidase
MASCVGLFGCAIPDAKTAWVTSPRSTLQFPSPNANARRPTLIVLHHTGEESFAQALKTLTDPKTQVSAHYLISQDGRIAQLVDEQARAWHAGVSRWGPIFDVNSASIGIELDNDGTSAFKAEQIDALIGLLDDLMRRYRIDPRNVVGHGDIAPGRKDDPSVLFPWRELAAHGIGLWCSAPALLKADASFDEAGLLRQIGYQVDGDAQLNAARSAFRRHFEASEVSGPTNADERALLACIADQQALTPANF